jgi:hypothetical protein
LDLSYNQLRNKISDMGTLFNKLERLSVLAVRENPNMKHFRAARLELIGSIERMRNVRCELRVIDSEVTVSERVTGWRRTGGSEEEAEKLRADCALWELAPAPTRQPRPSRGPTAVDDRGSRAGALL